MTRLSDSRARKIAASAKPPEPECPVSLRVAPPSSIKTCHGLLNFSHGLVSDPRHENNPPLPAGYSACNGGGQQSLDVAVSAFADLVERRDVEHPVQPGHAGAPGRGGWRVVFRFPGSELRLHRRLFRPLRQHAGPDVGHDERRRQRGVPGHHDRHARL